MKNLLKKLVVSVAVLFTIFALPSSSFATDPITTTPTPYDDYSVLCPENSPFCESANPGVSAETTTTKVLQIITGALLYIAAPIAVIVIIISGISMTINSGNSDKVEEAKNSLIWAIAGLGVIILSYSIANIVITLTIKAASAG